MDTSRLARMSREQRLIRAHRIVDNDGAIALKLKNIAPKSAIHVQRDHSLSGLVPAVPRQQPHAQIFEGDNLRHVNQFHRACRDPAN